MGVYDCIVLGVGTMGAPTCAELARRGQKVLGLDRFAPPHALGSHHGSTRLFRMAYFEHPDYVPLLRRAAVLWERVNEESGERVFVRTGALYAGPPEGEVVRGTLESARRHSLRVRELSREELSERFSQFRIPPGYVALFDEDGAVVLSEPAIAHYVIAAQAAGPEIRTSEPAVAWEERGGGVIVRTGHAEYEARSLVVSCGAWAGKMLPSLGVPLVVTRQVLGWVRPRDPAMFAPDRFPVWGIDNPDGSMHYGTPMMPGETGIKVARHARGEPTDPDGVDRSVRPADAEEVLAGVDRYLPAATREIVDSRVCLYTNSTDSNFILGRPPGTSRVFVACGFSGHGFKFAPVIGEALADLAMHGRTAHPVGFLSVDRFAR